ncbi:MAG: hypothetical protein EA378_08630 [Phycisphaerales bacterium]|nr:MAG: hypothetical protein EA378_08630 [Phycisphaerales bacterium]
MHPRDLAYILAGVAMSPVILRKSRGDWPARLGRTEALGPVAPGRLGRVLLHAVSVGEVNALRSLVPRLAREAEVVVSVTTDTGIARARALFAGDAPLATVVRYPLDFSWSVRRFLDAVRPDAVGLVELELWPGFLDACRARSIPVGVINGRLSERSFRGYHRFRRVVSPMFRSLAFAGVQDEAYAERFEAMGVKPTDCLLTGSMKWDAADPDAARNHAFVRTAAALAEELGIDRSRPLIVAGSTAEGEEKLLHETLVSLEQSGRVVPGTQLACAPRQTTRFDEAAAGLPGCVRRSARTPGAPGSTRFLLDTIGELRALYALADVVVLGRSFAPLYGSDPIEPAALGKATLIGPNVKDFEHAVGALERGRALRRVTREAIGGELASILSDPHGARAMGERGIACVRDHQGASERHAELLLSLLRAGSVADGGATRSGALAGVTP